MAVDNTNVAMGWDDEFEEGSEFLLLPEGDYNFTITQFERAYFNGSDKLPASRCSRKIINFLRVLG